MHEQFYENERFLNTHNSVLVASRTLLDLPGCIRSHPIKIDKNENLLGKTKMFVEHPARLQRASLAPNAALRSCFSKE